MTSSFSEGVEGALPRWLRRVRLPHVQQHRPPHPPGPRVGSPRKDVPELGTDGARIPLQEFKAGKAHKGGLDMRIGNIARVAAEGLYPAGAEADVDEPDMPRIVGAEVVAKGGHISDVPLPSHSTMKSYSGLK
ncbi:unnamed protein product [Parascedosporium putredinis]|uniref:Uncharacterized protein n=1 Tax=Parascedosporium putredinis TaxID=1442378 RepID=A0A9P1H5P0_9PEZI|nr:unnamed protein product [Parascedosporium putredinis]CAI7997085.1 unnamed protein product [Parascedosporium putredinis]